MPEAKVEKYKLTPETVAFVKGFKKIKRIGDMLQNAMEVKLTEAAQVRQMLMQVEGTTQELLQNAPENPTYELSEQDLENFRVTY